MNAVSNLFREISQLDNDELWELVCWMFPGANQETLEDLFDSLVATLSAGEPVKEASEVFASPAPMEENTKQQKRVDEILNALQKLSEEQVWLLFRRMFPDLSTDRLEDIFDGFLAGMNDKGPWIPHEEVVAEEERRREDEEAARLWKERKNEPRRSFREFVDELESEDE